jgi:hypothetical protein
MNWRDDDFYEDEMMFFGPEGMPVDRFGRPLRGFFGGGPVDLEGRPVERTKSSHPYSYDGHVVTRMRRNAKEMECAYTDRMWEWDRDKMERLTRKHMEGYRWDNCPGHQVEEFLREHQEDPGLELVAVMEWCNHASGYPTWSLHWVYSRKKRDEMAEEARRDALRRGCSNWKCEKADRPFEDEEDAVLDESRGWPRYHCRACAEARK